MINPEKTAFICIHGYNVSDYRNSTGKISGVLAQRGFYAVDLVYHADNVISARKKNGDIARRLNAMVKLLQRGGYDNVVVCAHSNGNAALRLCYDLHQPWIDSVFCIQPALPSEIHPYPTAKAHIFFNRKDNVVVMGKWLTLITKIVSKKWAAARNWGDMGNEGYNGPDDSVINIDVETKFGAHGHSGVFEDMAKVNHLVDYIIEQSHV